MLLRQGLATGVAILLTAAPAQAWTVRSPDRAVTATITTSGRLTARHHGRTVLTADLGRISATHVRRGSRRATFSTPSGKRLRHRLNARTLMVGGVELLATDDGVAFRGAPRTMWSSPAARAWLQPYNNVYENRYTPTRLSAAKPRRYGFPALLHAHGDWALLTESGLPYGASAAHLRARHGRLAVEGGSRAWRVALIGRLATVVASDLPLTLGRPSQIVDTSWIHPGRVAWSWWADAASTRSLARQKQYVDFAAAEHFEYTTVDAGWDAAWIPDLEAYAAARNVRVLLWTDWRALADPQQRAATLDRWASWGIAGIKVDYLHSDSGRRMAVMEDIARAAARRHLVVDFHGCTIPRGLQRTWPNVLAFEAVRGAEYDRDGTPSSPRNNVDIAFTRNVVGPMDYTPVTFSARNRVTTAGHELAMSVVYQSGLQHYADTPESYDRYPTATALLAAVPAAWDDTRLVAGRPDRYVVLARRSGDRWFVGALSAGAPRTLTVPLRFLAAGDYDAHVISDDLTETDDVVSAGDALHVRVGRNGGAVITLTPQAR